MKKQRMPRNTDPLEILKQCLRNGGISRKKFRRLYTRFSGMKGWTENINLATIFSNENIYVVGPDNREFCITHLLDHHNNHGHGTTFFKTYYLLASPWKKIYLRPRNLYSLQAAFELAYKFRNEKGRIKLGRLRRIYRSVMVGEKKDGGMVFPEFCRWLNGMMIPNKKPSLVLKG